MSSPANESEPRALCDEDELLAAVAQAAAQPSRRAFGGGAFDRLPAIYFIGDSRSITFRNVVYTSEFTNRSYLLRSAHLRSLYAGDFRSRAGPVNEALLNQLATDQALIIHDGPMGWTAARADGPNGPAPLVFFCGLADMFRTLDALGPDADIRAWDELSRRCDVSRVPASRLVSAEETLRIALETLEPFALGIEALRTMGFDRIFLHGCPRFTLGERFEADNRGAKWRRQIHPNVIAKALLLFDEAIRSIAVRTNARYVAGPVDADGVLPPEVTHDDVHYNDEGARRVVQSVVSVLEGVVE